MTPLRGGFRRTPKTLDEFFEFFAEGITGQEWQLLAQLPPIPDWIALVNTVLALREQLKWPMPYDHPLNPASRYEAIPHGGTAK